MSLLDDDLLNNEYYRSIAAVLLHVEQSQYETKTDKEKMLQKWKNLSEHEQISWLIKAQSFSNILQLTGYKIEVIGNRYYCTSIYGY